MVKCPKCGKDNPDESTYCSNCGEPLREPQLIPVPSETPTTPTAPTTKPVPTVRVITPGGPPVPTAPVRVPPPGMCFYHSNLPAAFVCSRCGRAICRDCAKAYQQLILCPQCYASIVPY